MREHALLRQRAALETKIAVLEKQQQRRHSFQDTQRRLARFGIFATTTRPTRRTSALPATDELLAVRARDPYAHQNPHSREAGVLIRPGIGSVIGIR